MSLILILSITIRIIAMVWSIALLRQLRDWRMAFLTIMLALMASRQILTLFRDNQGWVIEVTGHLHELPGLIVSILALIIVIYFHKIIIEHKLVEEALRTSEERFRDLVNLLPQTIYEADMEGNITFVNTAGLSTFETITEEIDGKTNIQDFVIPNDRGQGFNNLQTILQGEMAGPNEYTMLRKDGSTFPAIIYSSPRIKGGNMIGVRGLVIDITKRKQAEENLKNLTEQLLKKQKVLLELAKEDFKNLEISLKRIVEVDAEQLKVSRVSVWLYNQDHTEIICQCLYQDGEIINQGEMTLSANQFPRYFEALEQSSTISANDAHNDPRTSEFSKDYLSPLGITSMMDVPIRLQGSTIGIVCHEQVGPMKEWSVQDEDFATSISEMCALSLQIAERKQAEKVIEESENKYRTLFEQSADAILILEEGKFVDCNPATVKMLGYKNKEELLGTHPSELSPQLQPDGRNSFEKANEIISTAFDQGSIRFEWDHKRQNGEVFPVEVLLTAVPIGERKFIHVVWRDITERKQVEDELDQYQMQLRALATKITIAEEQERRRIAIELHDHIIQDLGLSKIKLGKIAKYLPEDNSLPLVLETRKLIDKIIKESRSLVFELSLPILYELGFEAAIKWLANQTEEKHKISCKVKDDGQPKPMSNEMQVLLFKAVRELMINVSKHAHANEVNIVITQANGEIKISVQDNGIGFNSAKTELYTGEALKFGLFGIRERLNLLKGSVIISSSPGIGTEVTLTAPLEIND